MTLLLLLLALASPSEATLTFQLNETLRKTTPFLVTVDQPAEDDPTDAVTSFRLYINGAIVQTQTASEAGCNTFPCSPSFLVAGGLSKGTYVLYIEAINAEGASASQSIRLLVTAGPPKVPTGIRITLVKPGL